MPWFPLNHDYERKRMDPHFLTGSFHHFFSNENRSAIPTPGFFRYALDHELTPAMGNVPFLRQRKIVCRDVKDDR